MRINLHLFFLGVIHAGHKKSFKVITVNVLKLAVNRVLAESVLLFDCLTVWCINL